MTVTPVAVRTTIRLLEARGIPRKSIGAQGIQRLLQQGYEPDAIVIAYCGQPKVKES